VSACAGVVMLLYPKMNSFAGGDQTLLPTPDGRCPVVLVPTTYPDWAFDDVVKAGASVVIYANQGLRETFRTLLERGESTPLESRIASVAEIFQLQQLAAWQALEA
jgi:phosphoenolpyruvate phosphomutase